LIREIWGSQHKHRRLDMCATGTTGRQRRCMLTSLNSISFESSHIISQRAVNRQQPPPWLVLLHRHRGLDPQHKKQRQATDVFRQVPSTSHASSPLRPQVPYITMEQQKSEGGNPPLPADPPWPSASSRWQPWPCPPHPSHAPVSSSSSLHSSLSGFLIVENRLDCRKRYSAPPLTCPACPFGPYKTLNPKP
jgi:hypothetical protein